VDIIKIDRSFVDGITTEAEDATLTEAVVSLGRSLRLQTVAEGIETPSSRPGCWRSAATTARGSCSPGRCNPTTSSRCWWPPDRHLTAGRSMIKSA
jgi:predicted signal transduction protein with EAL and GGDEF domain